MEQILPEAGQSPASITYMNKLLAASKPSLTRGCVWTASCREMGARYRSEPTRNLQGSCRDVG